jgi:hypothetical protein
MRLFGFDWENYESGRGKTDVPVLDRLVSRKRNFSSVGKCIRFAKFGIFIVAKCLQNHFL